MGILYPMAPCIHNIFVWTCSWLLSTIWPCELVMSVLSQAYHQVAHFLLVVCHSLASSGVSAYQRDCAVSDNQAQDLVSPEDLMRNKSQKQLVQSGLARFNAKPKTGLAFLEENGLIYQDVTPEDAPADVPKITRAESLAKFLKSSTRLDKKVLGDFLSKPENIDLLKAFIGLINFEGVRASSHGHWNAL